MVSLPTAILIAAMVVGVALPLGILAAAFFAYKIFVAAKIFNLSKTVEDAAFLQRQFTKNKITQEKVVAEMPDIEIAALAENPDILERLEAMQTTRVDSPKKRLVNATHPTSSPDRY